MSVECLVGALFTVKEHLLEFIVRESHSDRPVEIFETLSLFKMVDQFFDRTKGRPGSFFGEGIVAHVLFADPVCAVLSKCLLEAGSEAGATMHPRGTYLVIDGPQFSTRAESRIYRQWGVDVIGMTNLPEARVAREAEICYATLALATDYDCWHEEEDDVAVEAVLEVLQKSAAMAQRILLGAVMRIPGERDCPCARALGDAIITDPQRIPPSVKRDLHILLGKYLFPWATASRALGT